MTSDPVPSPSKGPRPAPRAEGKPSPSTTPRDSSPVKPADKATGKPADKGTGKVADKTSDKATDVTRTGMIWVAVSAGLVLLILLIIFILQNEDRVTVHYLGFAGELSLGMALFIATVAGGVLVAIAGAARILQLRSQRRRSRGPKKTPPDAGTPGKDRPTPEP